MKNTDRRLDLSAKFMQMGQSLILEGRENNDISISQIGTILVFISGILLGDDEDIFKFSDLCSMFSARKILDGIEEEGSPLKGLMKQVTDAQNYEDFIKKINEIRKNNNKDDVN
jgi:hypothetical protein